MSPVREPWFLSRKNQPMLLACGHSESDLTSDATSTFCAVCAVQSRPSRDDGSSEGERRYESWLESLKDHGP